MEEDYVRPGYGEKGQRAKELRVSTLVTHVTTLGRRNVKR